MTNRTYLWILSSIAVTIALTIGVQIYWNYNNYKLNKQRVSNEIQLSIDNALEEYYAEIAKSDYLTIIKPDSITQEDPGIYSEILNLTAGFSANKKLNSAKIASITFEETDEDTTGTPLSNKKNALNNSLTLENKKPIDSLYGDTQITDNNSGIHVEKGKKISSISILKGKKALDSVKLLKNLNTILISIDRDTIAYEQVDSLLQIQFKQKDISPTYTLKHFKKDSLFYALHPQSPDAELMKVNSKSTYLKPKERIVLEFQNPMRDTLKLGLTGILTSFILAFAIIACLFYLHFIIKNQKQLAEIKNDLINNITHEFKTPIATIGVALESLKDFNALADKAKTENYLSISQEQLGKLHTMVEKLLETATLDSEHLEMNKKPANLVEILQQITEKYHISNPLKNITFHSSSNSAIRNVDAFHFENAINNIIDNAIKYGGTIITCKIFENESQTLISVSDTGQILTAEDKDKIFEKFYRMPKGNTHDVKGFGIGLYYSKKIIEKHGGSILLNLNNNLTTFTISLPHE